MITAESVQESIQMGLFSFETFDYPQYLYNLLQDCFFEIYYQIIVQVRNFLQIYSLAFELRILFSWFLNINPYVQPFLTLWEITNPIMYIGRNIYPRPFGTELNFVINTSILSTIIVMLEKQVVELEPLHYTILERIFNR